MADAKLGKEIGEARKDAAPMKSVTLTTKGRWKSVT